MAGDDRGSLVARSAHHVYSHSLHEAQRGLSRRHHRVNRSFRNTSRAARAFNEIRRRAKVIRHKSGLAPKRSTIAKGTIKKHRSRDFRKSIRHRHIKSLKGGLPIWQRRSSDFYDTDVIEVTVISATGDQITDERENGATAPDRHIRECWQTSKVVQREGVKVRHIGRACRETRGLISLTPLSQQIVDAP